MGGMNHFRSAFARCGPIELRVKSLDGVFQMPKVPSENYERIVAALGRLGFVVVRQRGSHIRLEKSLSDGTLKITVPAHRPVKRSTLAKILKQADISLPDFLNAR